PLSPPPSSPPRRSSDLYFEHLSPTPPAISDLRLLKPLVILGDSITTDHISPSGAISLGTPAADYLLERNVQQKDFNNYTTRRARSEEHTSELQSRENLV